MVAASAAASTVACGPRGCSPAPFAPRGEPRRARRRVAPRRGATSARASSAPARLNANELRMQVTTFNVLAPCYRRVKQPDGSVEMESASPGDALDRQSRIVDMLTDTLSSVMCLQVRCTPSVTAQRGCAPGGCHLVRRRQLSAATPPADDVRADVCSFLPRRRPSVLPPRQEFWHASPDVRQLYERGLDAAGYATFVTPRTGNRPDGLLTAVKRDEFDVVEQRDILFNDCGDRVATLVHIRHRSAGASGGGDGARASLGDVLVVNTHLLFPHNSNSTLIRLRETFKILEYLHEYQEKMVSSVVTAGGRGMRLPVVMCGDFNGTIRGSVSRFLQSQGFESAYEVSIGNGNGGCECADEAAVASERSEPSRWISHLNHHGEVVGVDHVWVLNPSKQCAQKGGSASPPPSWKTAIYAMIQAKMLEKGLTDNDKAFAFFDVDSDLGITRDEFVMAVQMLGLTGEGTPGLVQSEIEQLYNDCDVDANGLVDFTEFMKNFDVESMERAYRAVCTSQDIEEGPWDVVGDLMTASASPTVLAGFTVDDEEIFDAEEEAVDRLLSSSRVGGSSSEGDEVMGSGEAREVVSAATLVRMSASVSRRDLAVASAALPSGMEAGMWPDDFNISDHGPLTTVLVPRRAAAVK